MAIQQALMVLGVVPPGYETYTASGPHSFVVPPGFTEVSVVSVGGGAGALPTYGGSGGGLVWSDNVSVIPGEVLDIHVGVGGTGGLSGGGGGCSLNPVGYVFYPNTGSDYIDLKPGAGSNDTKIVFDPPLTNVSAINMSGDFESQVGYNLAGSGAGSGSGAGCGGGCCEATNAVSKS